MAIQGNKILVSEDDTRLIAARRARGLTLRELETEFSLTRPVINRVLDTPLAKQVIKDISYDIVATEIAHNRRAVAELLPKAVEVILKQLEEGNLKAAELVIRASGMMAVDQSKETAQQQTIQVILPGSMGDRGVIDVTNIPEGEQ